MSDYPKDLFILEGISHLCFNKDYTQCALSKKDHLIYIYSVPNIMDTKTWTLTHTLSNHSLYISGLDWSPVTNQILSCSHDKTSYVWKYEGDKWLFDNVVATLKVSFLFCHWNKRGDKFVEGTGNKSLFIGYYSDESKWWATKPIRHHKRTSVVCGCIDPTSLFVISGAADMKVYITSCYIPEIDDKHLTEETKLLTQDFGTVVYQLDAGGWLINCEWSLDGNLAYASSQNGYIYAIDYKQDKTAKIPLSHCPATFIVPVSINGFYSVGYDREIFYYEENGGVWSVKKTITERVKKEKKEGDDDERTAGVSEALKKMNSQKKSKASLIVTMDQNENAHATMISSVTVKGSDMITSDLAGFVKYWKI